MSEENTPTWMSEEQLKTLALMMGRAQVSCMTEAIAKAATAASGLADSLDRLKALAEQFEEGTFEDDFAAKKARVEENIERTRSQMSDAKTKSRGLVDTETRKRIGPAGISLCSSMAPVVDEPEESGPTIAERLKAGEMPRSEAEHLLASLVTENIKAVCLGRVGDSPTVRFRYRSLAHGACFTIYDTGKATTGGKDSDLRQVLRDILESEGFDVRC